MTVQKQFIIKADDYGRGGANLDPWRRFIDCALDENLTLSIGVVGYEVAFNKAVPLYLRSIVEEYGIEIWNHSYKHPNFTTLNQAQIGNEILEAQKKIFNEIGVTPSIFGPPFNKIDVASANHVIDLDIFKGFYAFDGLVDPRKNIDLKYFSKVESSTDAFRPMRLEAFHAEMIRRERPDFLVLQVHPYYWSLNCLDVLRTVLRILKEESYICTNAEERINYLDKKALGINQIEVGRTLADNIIYEEHVIEVLESNIKSQQLDYRGNTQQFIQELRKGTSEIHQFYKNLGLKSAPRVDGFLRILNIGAGIGNWASAAALMEDAFVLASDIDDLHIGLMKETIGQDKINLEISEFKDSYGEGSLFSAIVCTNNLNALNIFDAMKVFWEHLENPERLFISLQNPAMLFISMQNRLHPLWEAIESYRLGEHQNALRCLKKLIENEGARAGLIRPPLVQYWNGNELGEVGLSRGLKLQRRNLIVPGSNSKLADQELYEGYLFIKTTGARRIKEQYHDGKISMKLVHSFDESNWLKTNNLIMDLYSKGILNENVVISEIFSKYGLDTESMSKERIDQLLLYINCAFIDLDLENFKIKFQEDNLFNKIFILYAALKININEVVEAAINNVESYLSLISADELSYWK